MAKPNILDGAKFFMTYNPMGAHLNSSKLRLFVRDDVKQEFRPVGLIQKLKVKASCKKPHFTFKIQMINPDYVRDKAAKRFLQENMKALYNLGFSVSTSK